jgi:hypothetical protein
MPSTATIMQFDSLLSQSYALSPLQLLRTSTTRMQQRSSCCHHVMQSPVPCATCC